MPWHWGAKNLFNMLDQINLQCSLFFLFCTITFGTAFIERARARVHTHSDRHLNCEPYIDKKRTNRKDRETEIESELEKEEKSNNKKKI